MLPYDKVFSVDKHDILILHFKVLDSSEWLCKKKKRITVAMKGILMAYNVKQHLKLNVLFCF